jgi:hypothetical protein
MSAKRFFGGRLSFTAPNVLSPKGLGSRKKDGEADDDEAAAAATAAAAAAMGSPAAQVDELAKTRRRLSMLTGVGDNTLIEGVGELSIHDGEGKNEVCACSCTDSIIHILWPGRLGRRQRRLSSSAATRVIPRR